MTGAAASFALTGVYSESARAGPSGSPIIQADRVSSLFSFDHQGIRRTFSPLDGSDPLVPVAMKSL